MKKIKKDKEYRFKKSLNHSPTQSAIIHAGYHAYHTTRFISDGRFT
jgi:hypothetical protein